MGKKEPKVPPPSMPANIVDAKQDAIKTNVDSWFEEILKWRSELRSGSEAETEVEEDQQPLYLVAAESLARTQGTTPQDILEQYAVRLEQSTYPTPDCLTPDEVLAYSKTGSEPRTEHSRTCAACAGLLSATVAPKERLAGFLEAVHSLGTMEGLPEPMPTRPWSISAPRRSTWRRVLAGVFVPVLALAVWLNIRSHKPTNLTHVASIAVLPIEDMSGSADRQYFMSSSTTTTPSLADVSGNGDGQYLRSSSTTTATPRLVDVSGSAYAQYLRDAMTSELISNLGTVKQLRVTWLDSSMAFAHLNTSISEIAQALNVDAVARCSLRHEGDQLFMSTTLFDAHTSRILGSESYQDDFRDALSLGNRLARAIAAHAGVRLTADEEARLEQQLTVEPVALESYFQGRYYLNKRNKALYQTAISQFQNATHIDSEFGLAYVGLADCYNLSVLRLSQQFKPKEAYENAIWNAEKAKELDPTLAGAYAAIALSKMSYKRDWVGAGGEFERALELNPNHAPTRHWYGLYLSQLGRSEEAISELTLTTELDPLSPTFRSALGDALYFARDYAGAVVQYKKALDIDVKYEQASWNLAMAYLHTGDFEKAFSTLNKAISTFNAAQRAKPSLALGYAVSGDKDKARQLLFEIAESPAAENYSSFDIATVYAALGDKNQAFKFLKKAVGQLDPNIMQLKVSPDVDSLRSDARFTNLLRDLKFPGSTI